VFPGVFHALSPTRQSWSDGLKWSVSVPKCAQGEHKRTQTGIIMETAKVPAAPLNVFLSSTCYDLVDLRSELAALLRKQGFVVRMSEDPQSGFHIDPAGDSIDSCLANVAASDVVICVLDRRYGPTMDHSGLQSVSATEIEVRYARGLDPPNRPLGLTGGIRR